VDATAWDARHLASDFVADEDFALAPRFVVQENPLAANT
jgi:hypothetical protein